jgi:hypothetical protein
LEQNFEIGTHFKIGTKFENGTNYELEQISNLNNLELNNFPIGTNF